MKKSLFGLLVAGAMALGAGPALHAQSDPAIVHVPFSFIAGGKVLPAGTYRIAEAGSDGSALMITSADDKAYGAFVDTERAANPAANTDDTHLAFRTYMGQHFLWEVVQPGKDAREVALQHRTMDQLLARLNLLPPERADVPAK